MDGALAERTIEKWGWCSGSTAWRGRACRRWLLPATAVLGYGELVTVDGTRDLVAEGAH